MKASDLDRAQGLIEQLKEAEDRLKRLRTKDLRLRVFFYREGERIGADDLVADAVPHSEWTGDIVTATIKATEHNEAYILEELKQLGVEPDRGNG